MPGPLTVPAGELESLGIAKETTFGTFVTPTLWHPFTTFDPKPKNNPVPRTGARKRYGQTFPATGSFQGSASLDVESDPDTLGQLLAFSMGNQSVPALLIINTTLSASTIIGATTFTVASLANIVPGMVLTFDTSANLETLTVASLASDGTVNTITTTTAATKAHASGVSVTLTSTTAYLSTMKLGLLPSFSAQLNRVTDAIDYTGCMVDSMALSMNAKAGLQPKFTLVYRAEAIDGAPAAPSFGTKQPFTFENPNNYQTWNGAIIGTPGAVSTVSMSVNLNNNLFKDYFSGGAGRFVQAFPQQQRAVKGSVVLGFETNAAYKSFLGAATGPNGVSIPSTSFGWVMCGSDLADATLGVPYMVTVTLPKLYATGHSVNNKSTGYLEQTFDFDASESGNGNQDDLTISYVGTGSAIF